MSSARMVRARTTAPTTAGPSFVLSVEREAEGVRLTEGRQVDVAEIVVGRERERLRPVVGSGASGVAGSSSMAIVCALATRSVGTVSAKVPRIFVMPAVVLTTLLTRVLPWKARATSPPTGSPRADSSRPCTVKVFDDTGSGQRGGDGDGERRGRVREIVGRRGQELQRGRASHEVRRHGQREGRRRHRGRHGGGDRSRTGGPVAPR